MQRLIPYLLTGFIVVFLPQNLLAEDPAGPPGPPNAQPARPNPEILFNRLDANHDGAITQDELPPDMPEMFKQLLFLADSNGDGKITLAELTAAINQHRPSPGSEPSTFGRRSRGPEGQADQMPGPSFGRRFGGPEGRPGEMAGPPFGGSDRQHGWMGGLPFGGPNGRFSQMAGPNFPGPYAGPHWMGGPAFNGPEGRPWAEQGYGPPHHWAAFGPRQERPWQQYGYWGQPNRQWQADFERPDRPWMAYGVMPQRPRPQYGQNWYQRLLSYNERPRGPASILRAIFDRLDTNHDNQLSFVEFSRGLKHLLRAILPGRGPQGVQMAGLIGGQGYGPWARQGFGPTGRGGVGPQGRNSFGQPGRRGFGPPGSERTE
jgi:hypothetical protein